MAQPSVLASGASAGGNISLNCPSGTNLLLLIYAEGRTGSGLATTPTYDGDDLTLIKAVEHVAGSPRCEIWGLFNPSTGSAINVVTGINDATRAYDAAVAVAIDNADTDIAFGSWTTYGASGDSNATTEDISESVTLGGYDLAVDGEGHFRTTTPTAETTGQTEIRTGANYGTSYYGVKGTNDMIWDLQYSTGNEYAWSCVVVPGKQGASHVMMMGRNF